MSQTDYKPAKIHLRSGKYLNDPKVDGQDGWLCISNGVYFYKEYLHSNVTYLIDFNDIRFIDWVDKEKEITTYQGNSSYIPINDFDGLDDDDMMRWFERDGISKTVNDKVVRFTI